MSERGKSAQEPPAVQVRPQTWLDPGTWSASFKFLPAYVVLFGIFIAVYYNNFADTSLDLNSYETCVSSFDYRFPVNAARSQTTGRSTRARDIAYAFEAVQQVHSPHRSVFGADPFPGGKLPSLGARKDEGSLYFEKKIKTDGRTLQDEEVGSVLGSAALGVPALMYGQRWGSKSYLVAAARERNVLDQAPRYSNGAIGGQENAELWSDAIGLYPPFLAYYAVANNSLDIMQEAVRQIELYRDVLRIPDGPSRDLWKHIVSPAGDTDAGAWSTGNALAAYGMARVRATIAAWPTSNITMLNELSKLDNWIQEIVDGAIRTDDDGSGLLRNYLGDSTWDGESTGTSLLAATAYRMALINPDMFGHPEYLEWARRKRQAVLERVDEDGKPHPAVNSLVAGSKEPVDFSSEGANFLLLLGTAWRDNVCSGRYPESVQGYVEETDQEIAPPINLETITGRSLQDWLSLVQGGLGWYRQQLRDFWGVAFAFIKQTFETVTGISVDRLYEQAMEPLDRFAKYFSGPS